MAGKSAFLITVIMSLTAGILIGYSGFIGYGPVADYCHIRYVAEEEIMNLERKRVEAGTVNPKKRDLFFGEIDRAVELTIRVAQNQNDRKTKVIFSLSPVFARGVESISEQIHMEVVRQLARENGKSINNE